MSRRLVVHCNAGAGFGMGHLMRSLAVAEEALRRGWTVRLAGDLTDAAVAFTRDWLPSIEVRSIPGSDLSTWLSASSESPDVLHFDSYWADDFPSGDWLRSNMQDGSFGVRPADVVIDANLGAEDRFDIGTAAHALVGVTAVPIREQVRRQRDVPAERVDATRLLVVVGGTDPFGITPAVVSGLGVLRRQLEVTVVTPADQRAALESIAARSPHRVTLVPFLADLPAVARQHDFVISAAGTSVWDFACMGVPMALLCVADNQRDGYAAVLDSGIAFGLGLPPHDDLADRLAALDRALDDPALLAVLADKGRELVDGLGAWRIVSAWEQLVDVRPVRTDHRLVVRPATMDDARLLLDWRNDPQTRRSSRSTDEVTWDSHIRWLSAVLGSPTRQLYVAYEDDRAVGTVRWDHLGGRDWEVSITVAPSERGRGMSLSLLQAGEDALEVEGGARLVAATHVENDASRRLFRRAGYLPLTPPSDHGFAVSARWRPPRRRPMSVECRD